MAIPFDFRALGRATRDAGQILAGGILKTITRKEEEKTWRERAEITLQHEMSVKKEMADHSAKIQKDLSNWQADQRSLADTFGGNILVAKKVIGDMVSMNTNKQLNAMATQDLFTTLGMDKDLSEEQVKFMEQLDPITQMTIGKMHTERQRYQEEMKLRMLQVEGIAQARELELERKQQLMDDATARRIEREDKILRGYKQDIDYAVDTRDEALGGLVDILTENKMYPVYKGGGFWVKNVNILSPDGKISPEGRAFVLKKLPSLRLKFDEIDKLERRIEETKNTLVQYGIEKGGEDFKGVEETEPKITMPKKLAPTREPTTRRKIKLVVGQVYQDSEGRKARYLGMNKQGKPQWKIIE